MPKEAAMLDEDYFEPSGEAGNTQMLQRRLGGGAPSNEKGIPMSQEEGGVRQGTFRPRMISGGR